MGFGGLRVLSLESRRAAEMAELIRKQGGEAFVAVEAVESHVPERAYREESGVRVQEK